MVREPDATMQPTPQDNQLMSKHRVLSLKPQLRLEWRGQDGQNETEQTDHSASLGDSITASTRIRFSVHTGDLVLDPFLGSGTTLIAAERIGRTCFGIELDPLYIDTIIRRWQRFTGDRAVHVQNAMTFDEISERAASSNE
jgi:hypothetical protein